MMTWKNFIKIPFSGNAVEVWNYVAEEDSASTSKNNEQSDCSKNSQRQ